MEEAEAHALASLSDVDWPDGVPIADFVKDLLSNLDHGNNRSLAVALAEALVIRAEGAAAHTKYEMRQYNERMTSALAELKSALETEGVPEQMNVPGGRPFEAKSEARAFLAQAQTDILVVDNYIGAGTLDCLLDARQPIP